MFEVGFSEILLILLVALVVLGPERLPRAARTLGHLLGRFKRYVYQVKYEIHQEMHIADLKKMNQDLENTFQQANEQLSATIFPKDLPNAAPSPATPDALSSEETTSLSKLTSDTINSPHNNEDKVQHQTSL